MKNIVLKGIELVDEGSTSPTGEYTSKIKVLVGLDTIEESVWSKEVYVTSNNSQTGAEVDEQRMQVALEYVNSFNL